MNLPDRWRGVFAKNVSIRVVDEEIYSVLSDSTRIHLYDRRAAIYDLVVGTSLYNRVAWGASLSDYLSFAQRAVASGRDMMLDAGCGSLLFTAEAYLDCKRPVVACDQSLEMLRRAKARLIKLAGRKPDHILLLQADLSELPFRLACFQTILCMNVLHHIADARALLADLETLLVDRGELYVTSLVKSSSVIGDWYLERLYSRGDFVRPRTAVEFRNLLDSSARHRVAFFTTGNMAFATVTATTK